MSDRSKRIETLEKELCKLGVLKNENLGIESICNNINGKINSLNKLRDEIQEISKDMHYYDLIDYLGKVPCSQLSLNECTAIVIDLSSAHDKFQADSDTKYLALCTKIKDKVILTGIRHCEMACKNDLPTENISAFYKTMPEPFQNKIEKIYLTHRKVIIKKKITECALDLTKNYKLLILGEIKYYEKIFKKGLLEKYKEKQFPTKNSSDFGNFEFFICEIFTDIFKRLKLEACKNLLLKIQSDNSNPSDAVLNNILVVIADMHFKLDNFEIVSYEI